MKTLFLFAFLLLFALPASAATIVPVSNIQSGDLIRGQTFNAVYYYGRDGLRYVFPNDKTFFTWYQNFNNVKWISDKDLATIQIGGNVTYKPGVKMLKINSDPTVYTLSSGGTLHAVASEGMASTLYGTNWNKQIDDVPDGFFSNYQVGSELDLASQYDPAAEQREATDINTDKQLTSFITVSILDGSYEAPTTRINSGTAIRFINNGTMKHTATEWDSVWGSGTLNPGEHYTRVFHERGTWHYYCKYHRETMEGALIVN